MRSRALANAESFKGKKFLRWTVLSVHSRQKNGAFRVLCKCECGTVKPVELAELLRGKTKSCGCYNSDATRERAKLQIKHGAARNGRETREYRSWKNAKARCYQPSSPHYKRYGGRGIKMCDSWRNSFPNFLADMGTCPEGLQIERKNNDGDYCKENCIWADCITQGNNTSRNHRVTHNGITRTITQWARATGISKVTILGRLTCGWSVQRAITTPVR